MSREPAAAGDASGPALAALSQAPERRGPLTAPRERAHHDAATAAMDLHYFDTLIAVAEDCPVTRGTAPTGRGGQPTVATLQYAMLADGPYLHTQEDVLFEVWWARQVRPPAAERARLRAEFFARPQACLRASPLPKQFGWGLLFDARGKLALCAMESAEYRRLVAGDRVKVVRAMRSRRA